jgi:hypothetical protein
VTTPNPTLEQLRDHARSKPNHLFPLGSCTDCLACDLTGKHMAGHDRFEDGEPVPPELAALTRGACDAAESARCGALVPGVMIAAALDRVLAGDDPYHTGRRLWEDC